MKDKRRVTLSWHVLLIAYWAGLFTAALLALTAGLHEIYCVALLLAGVPVYLMAATAIVRLHDIQALEQEVDAALLITVPSRAWVDEPFSFVTQATVEVGASHQRARS